MSTELVREEPPVAGSELSADRSLEVGRRGELRTLVESRALRYVLAVFVGARLSLGLLAALAVGYVPRIPETSVQGFFPEPYFGLPAVLWEVWRRWDGYWYLKIAEQGYQSWDGTTAFFPAYPLLLEAVHQVTGLDRLFAGIVVSNLAALAALYLLYQLAQLDYGDRVAQRAVLFLVSFPTAFFLFALYTESLFLATVLGAFLLGRQGRWLPAGLLVAVATLTRSQAAALLPAMLWLYGAQQGWQIWPWRLRLRWDLLWVLFVLLAVGGHLLLMQSTTGDPLAMIHAQKLWGREFHWPWETAGLAVQAALRPDFWPPESPWHPFRFWDPQMAAVLGTEATDNWRTNVLNLAFALAFLAAVPFAFRWLPRAYAIFLVVGLVLPLFTTNGGMPFFSMPRFVLVLFPVYLLLARLEARLPATGWIRYGSVLLLAVLLTRFVNWHWVA